MKVYHLLGVESDEEVIAVDAAWAREGSDCQRQPAERMCGNSVSVVWQRKRRDTVERSECGVLKL